MSLSSRGAAHSCMSVSESGRTSLFNEERKRRRFASLWVIVMSSAAVLVVVEGFTAALAGYDFAVAVRRLDLERENKARRRKREEDDRH